MKRILLFLFLIPIIILSSCKKDFSKISTSHWTPELAVPFVQTELTLGDLIATDSTIGVTEDSLMVYYYQQDSIIALNTDSLINITDTLSDIYDYSLGDIAMGDFNIGAVLSLNDILPYLNDDIVDSLLVNDGEIALFPPFQLLSAVNVEMPPVSLYETLSFSKGYFEIELVNELPVALKNIRFDILDVVNNRVIKSGIIDLIDVSSSAVDTLFLNGKTLSNTFSVIIKSMETDGSYPEMVLINLSDGMDISLKAREMRVVGGVAKIENQIIYSSSHQVNLDFSDKRLWEILFSEGEFKYKLSSSLNFNVDVLLQLTSAEVGGEMPENSFRLSANNTYESSWGMNGMYIDLSTNPEHPYNQMPFYLKMVIEPTVSMVEFDSSNLVQAIFALQHIKTSFAKGNFGKQNQFIEGDTIGLNSGFLAGIDGEIIFDDPVITINYENSFGIPMVMYTDFTGIDQSTGSTIDLNVDSLVFSYPKVPGEVVNDFMRFDKTNSAIVEFINFMPDKIVSSGDVLTNWNDDTVNFFTGSSSLIVNSEIKIPMVFSTTSLVFSDTLPFLSGQVNLPVESGSVILNVLNGLPFDFILQLQIPDSITGKIIDQINFDVINSAIIDDKGKVISATSSTVKTSFNTELINNLSKANQLFLIAETVSAGEGIIPVGLYSDSKIEIAISFDAKLQP